MSIILARIGIAMSSLGLGAVAMSSASMALVGC
jgi:hypothetical protein